MNNSESGMAKKNIVVRFLAFSLAAIMMLGAFAVVPVLSVESEPEAEQSQSAQNNSEIVYDEDVLSITVDGEERTELEIYENEKVTIKAEGVLAAKYQWQILHPERSGLWVDIYEETKETLDVSLALTGNMEQEDGKTYLRCLAYEADGAYVTDVLSVTILEGSKPIDAPEIPTVKVETKNPHLVYADGDDHPEFVTVTIKYEKWENQYNPTTDKYELKYVGPAFSSYMATIQYGKSFKTTVTNPTIVGYDSYFGDETTSSPNVVIDIAEVTDNVEYVVNYKPAVVKYEIHYFFQNIYDDLYAEDNSIKAPYVGSGYTGMPPVDGIEAEVPGFTALYYQPDTIAADGSTVFEVYFERNYYLMEFDCDGGFGVHTIYVRHGTYISIATPTKPGYIYQGWNLVRTEDISTVPASSTPIYKDGDLIGYNLTDNTIDTVPNEMPKYNTAYKAVWDTTDTTYTIVYWIDNGNNTQTYLGSRTVEATSASTVGGYNEFTKLTDTMNICGKEDHAHDTTCKVSNLNQMIFNRADTGKIVEGDGSTIVNIYYEYRTYTFKFYYAKEVGGKYYIPGGSTWAFAGSVNNITTQLGAVGSWGEVNKPTLSTTDFNSNTYDTLTVGTETANYYYITMSARYGEDISQKWPANPFNPVQTVGTFDFGDYAYFSAWNVDANTKYDNTYENKTLKGNYQKLDDMLLIDENTTTLHYLAFWENGAKGVGWNKPHQWTYKVYIPSTSEDDYDHIDNGIKYNLYGTYTLYDDNDINSTKPYCGQTYTALEGYTFSYHTVENLGIYNTEHSLYKYQINFYYVHNSPHQLKLYNYNGTLIKPDKTPFVVDNVYYDTLLKQLMGYDGDIDYFIDKTKIQENHYPTNMEPGAYEFGGWYKTPTWVPGTEVDDEDWETITMPDGNLTLYAKWTPIVRDVTYYLTYTEVKNNNPWQPDPENPISYPIKVPHGQLLGTTYNYIPERGEDYDFIGWFYFDENGKKKFAPDSMKVTRNLELFAEWNSKIPTTYEVKYEAWTDKSGGKYIEDIADVLFGYSTAGKTTTFNAKGGEALYDKNSIHNNVHYQAHWFPKYSSHSILMDEDSAQNTFTFRYFYKDKINYKVIHIDRATGEILGESEVKSTPNAVVTEKFETFKDYLPESYYIEKSIAYDPTDYSIPGNENHVQPENIIYFYYNEDKSHDPFRVEHWYQNVEDDGYTLMYTENGVADNGVEVTAKPRDTDGFVHNQAKAEIQSYYLDSGGVWQKNPIVYGQLTGTVTEHGLEMKLFYDRITVDYTVKYVEFGSDPENVLFSETISGSKFGSTVEEIAPATYEKDDLDYVYFDAEDELRSKSITIRENASNNVIIFYYNLKKIPVFYHIVCTVPDLDELNGVSVSMQYVAKIDSNVNSTAMAGKGFAFEGWFYDEACTQEVPETWIKDGSTIYPQTLVEDSDGTEHFYALFEPVYGSLKLTKSAGTTENNESFLFHIKGKAGTVTGHIDMIVTITDSGSKILNKLPIGSYTVTEMESWSWTSEVPRNEAGALMYPIEQNVTVKESTPVEILFGDCNISSDWLTGEDIDVPENNKN